MSYNYSKLNGRIKEKFRSQSRFAAAMQLSERSLSLKLNNKLDFKQEEISRACELLGIGHNEIASYFFANFVQQN